MTNIFMANTFELVRRTGLLRASLFGSLVLILAGCDSTEPLNLDASTLPEPGVEVLGVDAVDDESVDGVVPESVDDAEDESLDGLTDGSVDGGADESLDPDAVSLAAPVLASATFRGGIPFGTSGQPTSAFGDEFSGALRNIYPQFLLAHLKAIKARGGKVILTFGGSDRNYRDSRGFNMTKWKAQVDRFKNLNITSYINDGTIAGHYLVDEPHWKGRWVKAIPPATVEEMAKYSKQRWPGLATIVRTYPEYMLSYRGNYKYLDAAWAQYGHRKGEAGWFIRKHVADAQKKGLGLVVGMNVLRGGVNKSKMTASQVRAWGSTLLSSSYPCAFISWQYNSSYLSSRGIKDAMRYLRAKAENRSARSCRG